MTLGAHLGQLVSVSSAAIAAGPVTGLPHGERGAELGELLHRRNGFVAFESALIVRGAGPGSNDLAAWNAENGWRSCYSKLSDGVFFFAEDVFGGQFGLRDEVVVSFDPETGDQQVVARSLDAWAERVLDDAAMMTGHPVAHAWQRRFGPLPLDQRLIPKVPFVLGGDFAIENLYALDSTLGMQVRGELAVQIHDLPDGAQVTYRVVD